MKTRLLISWAIVLLVVLALGAMAWDIARHGADARSSPGVVETWLARTMRHLAMPRASRNLRTPMQMDAEMLTHARRHWADHCASCHANDGSGETELGRNMYPRVPDMRKPETQNLSDGELYSIIEGGVRLSGMPAWGTGGTDDHQTWELVAFIRHLPKLTPDELKDMEDYNPKSRQELNEEQEEEEFLKGKDKVSQ